MPTSKFDVSVSYSVKDGDYIVMPFCDGKNACFTVSRLPRQLADVKAPGEKGAGELVYAGRVGRAKVVARSVRLDDEVLPPATALKKAVAAALADAVKNKMKRVVVFIDAKNVDCVLAVQEGALLGGYSFDKYLSKKKKPLPVVVVAGGRSKGLLARIKEGETVCACTNFARDVLNAPANEIHPESLAGEFAKFGKSSGLKVEVWNEARLRRERCGGVIGVGQGAKSRPRMVIGEYNPRGAKKHIALVGKGVTFDTGGYCLKPGPSQVGMKFDMGGAAMMFGAACAIARLKLPVRVTVVTPLAENDISSTAYHTTDILTTRSGKTIEVNNTDAEGRLILADALTVAQERKPDFLIDSATLTGACVMALGEDIAAAYGTDKGFTQKLLEAGAAAGENFWEMPLHKPYLELLKSDIADTSNLASSRWGGSITAALFLGQWVDEKQKWIHCDIAGPGCKDAPLDHLGKGSKGFGVKSMVGLARML